MLKHCLLGLVAAGLILIAAPLAAAQDIQSNNPQSAPSQGNARHSASDPARRTQQLTNQLNLTSDQQPKVQEILQSKRSQKESLHQDTSLPQQDRRSKMMDVQKSSDAQIRALLDSTQQQKWDEMQAKRQQWMQNRHQGAPAAASGQREPPVKQ